LVIYIRQDGRVIHRVAHGPFLRRRHADGGAHPDKRFAATAQANGQRAPAQG
jgi:hypothetical protein